MASLPNGELIVTNLLAPNGNTYKLNPDGDSLWQLVKGGSAITQQGQGPIWIAGTKVTSRADQWDLRILAISGRGQLLFQDEYDGRYQDRAVDLALDEAENG